MSPALIWFCVGIGCFAMEIFAPTFVLMFFGVGALAASAMALVVHDLVTEMVLFSIVSIASLVVLRRRVLSLWGRTRAAADQDDTPQGQPGQAGQTGRTGTVSVDIPAGGQGEVSLGGSFWRATSDISLPEGTQVVVLDHAKDNELLLIVERLNVD